MKNKAYYIFFRYQNGIPREKSLFQDNGYFFSGKHSSEKYVGDRTYMSKHEDPHSVVHPPVQEGIHVAVVDHFHHLVGKLSPDEFQCFDRAELRILVMDHLPVQEHDHVRKLPRADLPSELFFVLRVDGGNPETNRIELLYEPRKFKINIVKKIQHSFFCQNESPHPNWLHPDAREAPVRIEHDQVRLLSRVRKDCVVIGLGGNALFVEDPLSFLSVTTTPSPASKAELEGAPTSSSTPTRAEEIVEERIEGVKSGRKDRSKLAMAKRDKIEDMKSITFRIDCSHASV